MIVIVYCIKNVAGGRNLTQISNKIILDISCEVCYTTYRIEKELAI